MSGKNQASGNATLELSIDLISAGGDGLGFYQGKAVFVPLTAPGERIVAQVRQDKPDFMRAELLSLVQPSPDRVEAPCKLYGQCGGCNLMH
ncbi:MAG TPA: TRAM domain-containing protein, partial [Spirochaetales bacterium]|nr:TRAM domain-containing protein [Spirochaetales bacterium]